MKAPSSSPSAVKKRREGRREEGREGGGREEGKGRGGRRKEGNKLVLLAFWFNSYTL
jgi:hypothetical protein